MNSPTDTRAKNAPTPPEPFSRVAVRCSDLFGQIADEILTAMMVNKPRTWTTWDSWAGRPVYNEEPEHDFKLRIIREVLERHWPNDQTERPAATTGARK